MKRLGLAGNASRAAGIERPTQPRRVRNEHVISGKVTVNKRAETIKRFQEEANPHVLIIQPQAASHGLTLTAANKIYVFYPQLGI